MKRYNGHVINVFNIKKKKPSDRMGEGLVWKVLTMQESEPQYRSQYSCKKLGTVVWL